MDAFDIAEVARRTGLSSRALRFYEARGLVSPLRTASGRRLFGAGEMARVHQLMLLKRAGFTLADIKRLFDNKRLDLGALLRAQIVALDDQSQKLGTARALLQSALSRIDAGERLDAATFCSLIKSGESMMSEQAEAWKGVTDRYMSATAIADFEKAMPDMGAQFDQADYSAKWKELGDRLKAALPMDPASAEALGFVKEWFALLAPFTAVATPAMWEGAQSMYAKMDEWEGQSAADPGFDAASFAFISEATAAAKTAGHDIGPLPSWATGSTA
jgi:MerR family transcriptional regulator, thiopeptide resistance regulator